MVLKYHISAYPALTENMVVRIWEAESDGPGGWVFEEVIPERDNTGTPSVGAGHQVKYTLVANGLDAVVHIVRLFSQSGTLLHEYNAEPKTDLATVFDPIQFKIGDGGPNTPAPTDTVYQNDALIGLLANEYTIMRNNYGLLFPVTHYDVDSATGSWTLTGAPAMNDDEEFTIQLKPKLVQTVINDSVVGKLFKDVYDIVANVSYTADKLRKLHRFTGPFTYTFNAVTTVPINYLFSFQHFGGAGTAKVKFDNGTLLWGGAPKAEINIPRYSEGAFIWDGTHWNVLYFVDTSFVNGASIAAGTVLGSGNFAIGDVPAGDPAWNVVHGLNIPGDYNVLLSIKTNNAANYSRNNKLGHTWWHDAANKPNSFNFSIQEIAGEAQDVSMTWLLIKL